MRKLLCGVFSLAVFFATLQVSAGNPDTPEEIKIEVVAAPRERLTTHWCFVIDNSHSMRGVFNRVLGAWLEATKNPTDQLEYSIVAFNNQNMDRFRDWEWASEESFTSAYEWIIADKHGGVLSYGATAITTAIQQERDMLTVVLITDGGFTEVSRAGGNWDVMRRVFVDAQKWRDTKGLGEAIVTTIGISNPNYTAGNKPSDKDCQAFLREIGTRYGGGYTRVTGAIR